MKVQQKGTLSAFGGINFVFDFLKTNKINSLISSTFPTIANQSKYSWQDIINSLLSIYLCGGDCIEDLHTHLKGHFINNPFVKIPSPDTVLKRLKELAVANRTCYTKKGAVEHAYNNNILINQLNISLLKQQGVFNLKGLTLDYDNTVIFNEKSDSKMTYKRNPGYQPGVCTINEEFVLYLEGRNGHSDAKSFQHETLMRMFDLLEQNQINEFEHMRADAASYQYEVVKLLEQKVKNFYIGCRNSYIAKYFTQIEHWEDIIDSSNELIQIGEIYFTPFIRQAQQVKDTPKQYRLIVKRKIRPNNQLDLFTRDNYEYSAILTNNTVFFTAEVVHFYNQRGNMERQFDVLKNDFGWNKMSFSTLDYNTVFLGITAFIKNLYVFIIQHFSQYTTILRPTDRVKKFLFRFIILPSKWIRHSRQLILKIFSDTDRYSALINNTS